MAQPRIRNRRKPPATGTRTMELLGVGLDGGLYVWEETAQVQPLSRFPRNGDMIKSGHYVIEHKGAAITVHCANGADGLVILQYMCGGLPGGRFRAEEIEPLLVGKVIPDPVKEAEILQMLQDAMEALDRRAMAPHRRRGTL